MVIWWGSDRAGSSYFLIEAGGPGPGVGKIGIVAHVRIAHGRVGVWRLMMLRMTIRTGPMRGIYDSGDMLVSFIMADIIFREE